MFPLICVGINGCINNRQAGDLRRYCAHYDVSVMRNKECCWPEDYSFTKNIFEATVNDAFSLLIYSIKVLNQAQASYQNPFRPPIKTDIIYRLLLKKWLISIAWYTCAMFGKQSLHKYRPVDSRHSHCCSYNTVDCDVKAQKRSIHSIRSKVAIMRSVNINIYSSNSWFNEIQATVYLPKIWPWDISNVLILIFIWNHRALL